MDAKGDRDGLPNVVLEAMASGRPVVASDVARHADAPSSTGAPALLVAAARRRARSRGAIERLADRPDMRERLGRAARAQVEADFELHSCTARLRAVLESRLCAEHGRTGHRRLRPQGLARGISELFIASEIYRLEQLGLPLRLYVIKPADEAERHPVVDRIQAAPRRTCRRRARLSATTLVRVAARERRAVPARAAPRRAPPPGRARRAPRAARWPRRSARRKGRSPGRARSTSRSCCRRSPSPTSSPPRRTSATCTPTSPTARPR